MMVGLLRIGKAGARSKRVRVKIKNLSGLQPTGLPFSFEEEV
jgi:hypothetical protein